VYVGKNPVWFDNSSSSDNKTFTGTVSQTYGNITAKVVSYKDMSNNEGSLFQQDVDFKYDSVQPKLADSELLSFNNRFYLVLHYDEDVNINGSFTIYGTYTYKIGDHEYPCSFSRTVTPVAYSKAYGADVNDRKSIMIDITNNSYYPPYDYEITIPLGAVKDLGDSQMPSMEGEITFSKAAYVSDKSKPYVKGIPEVSDDFSYIDIAFSEEIDLNSVLELENYKANGIVIFNRAELSNDKSSIRLYIAKNLVEYSGDRMLDITGIKDIYGNAMDKYRKIVYIRENDKPYIDYAVVENRTYIKIVFNENVKYISNYDFSIYMNGAVMDGSKVNLIMDGVYAKQIRLNVLDDSINLYDPNISLQVKVEGGNIMDMSNNLMDSGTLVDVLK
jgi:hypothetical protein